MHRGAPVGMAGRRRGHRAQGVEGRVQVGQRGGVQPVADGAPRAVDLVRLGVDLGPAGRGVQRRRLAELEREVQPLAQQQHGVGLRQHLGKGAQAGVGHAARAFHADDGHAQRGFQRGQAGAAGARQRRGAGQDQRPFGPLQARQQVARAGFGQRLRGRHEGVGRGQRRGVGRAFQRVAGQAQVHRAGPAAAGRLHRARQVGGHRVGAGTGPGGLAHRGGHVGLAHFLEGAHAALAVRAHGRTTAPPGDSAINAVYSADTALAWPGPPVTRATPTSPVSRAQASAMCTAAASWRVWISRIPLPSSASNTGMMWLPDSVKTIFTPARCRACTSRSAPRGAFGESGGHSEGRPRAAGGGNRGWTIDSASPRNSECFWR
jgi:hypothetical protein